MEPSGLSETIERALHATAAAVEDVTVDHGRPDILVTQELLNGADVIVIFQQMGGERMAQYAIPLATRPFGSTLEAEGAGRMRSTAA